MRLAVVLFAAAAQLCGQHLLTWDRHDNTFRLQLEGGATAELEFITQSAFRVRRGLQGPPRKPISEKKVDCKPVGTPAGLRIETEELVVTVARASSLVTVQLPAGVELFAEQTARVAEGKAMLHLRVPKSEQFFGLGPRPQSKMDARGLVLQPDTPFFVTSNGWAFWTDTPAAFEFDMGKTRADAVHIAGDGLARIEYYFAFGPSLKEIWDNRHRVTGDIETPTLRELQLIEGSRLPRSARALPKSVLKGQDLLCAEANALVHASLSGVLMPAMDLARYRDADETVLRRAARLAVFSPVMQDSSPGPAEGTKQRILEDAAAFRKRLGYFLITYADEARYRGYPMIHPLLHQFPRDSEAGRHIDEFMFGDEFLVVPVCDGSAKRDVYLPMGNWTDWNTGVEHRGRRTVPLDVPPDGVIVLLKSGSVLPLNGVRPQDPTELHYFPRNGGEFFIFEPDVGDYTQAHAGPAVDFYRVEIESKVDRLYEWVVHHMNRPKTVVQVEGPQYEETQAAGPLSANQWRYDESRRELHIGVHAKAHSDVIVNIHF